jgi:hypothetical protein
MKISRTLCAWLILIGVTAPDVQANWMVFTGGPTVATGVWPAGSQLTGTAVATQSNVFNGNNATLPIGLVPISVGPALSPAYNATLLTPNVGNLVTSLGAPYNDTGDKYHVDIDFFGTTGGSNPNVLPAGSIFAILDLDITENFRKVSATDASNNQIITPWIAGPSAYFDMNNPVFIPGSNPTLNGPFAGVYDMLGVNFNFDVGFWLFNTTQDVRRISFDMEVGVGGNQIGGGGGTWAFYTANVPEPTTFALVSIGLAASSGALRRRLRR